MVYDCFTFFNELDLLEIRLHTLNNVVDKFVIAEATRTHSGKPKELFFEQNRARFSEFDDKIIYVVVDDLLPEEVVAQDAYNLPWVNENRQRNALVKGVLNASDDDVIMVSDADELPNPEAVGKANLMLAQGVRSVRLEMDLYNFYINFKNYSYPKWKLGTAAVQYGVFKQGNVFSNFKCDRYTQESENKGPTFNQVRFISADAVIRCAGWHFSFLGGVDAIQKKLVAFSHSEYASLPKSLLEKRLMEGKDLFGRVGRSYGVFLDGSFPKYVIANKQKFVDLIFPVNAQYCKKTKLARYRAKLSGIAYKIIVSLVPQSLAPFCVRLRDQIMRLMKRI